MVHRKIPTRVNYFADRDYVESRTKAREIQNVTGNYQKIWERQEGKCYMCGKPILSDQEKAVIPVDPNKPPTMIDSAYIHKTCEINEFEIIRNAESVTFLREYDVAEALDWIVKDKMNDKRHSDTKLTPAWKYYKLKEYFAKETRPHVTLTFKEIEKILGFELPHSAHVSRTFWCAQHETRNISDAWNSEGYNKKRVDLNGKKVTFYKVERHQSRLKIPDVLFDCNIPNNAIFELETYFDYIIDRYGLRNRKI